MTVSKRRQIGAGLALVGCVVVVLAVVKAIQISRAIAESKMFGPPPEAVTSLVVAEREWPRTIRVVGSLDSSEGVVVSAESAGKVTRILFEPGAMVSAGTPLVELDSSVELANLAGVRALAEVTERNRARAQALRKANSVSQSEYDDAAAKAREAAAAVASLEATVARKRIAAPFSGRLGIRTVALGEHVEVGGAIVPLYALDPLHFNFSIPQQFVSVVEVGQHVRLTVDAFPGEVFAGTVTAVNPQVDARTRNLRFQATIPNPSGKLRPGMFAEAMVDLPSIDHLIAVPSSGIQYAPFGDTVYVIESMRSPDGSEYLGVRQQIVKLGSKIGDLVPVLEGLKVGERVVTSGTFKLRPGAAVVINDNFVPARALDPTPSDT
jgi:membrane fusion protein (multidrug efflux system)